MTIIREARRRIYESLSTDSSVTELATGGIIPINEGYSFQDRVARGPHLFYYPQSHIKDGFRRWRVRMVVEVVVPFGAYEVDGETVDAYEYSEQLMSRAMRAVERTPHGAPQPAVEIGGGLMMGDGVYIWQIYVETVVTETE